VERIAQAGRQRMLAEHTYVHRMMTLLGIETTTEESDGSDESGGSDPADGSDQADGSDGSDESNSRLLGSSDR